MFTRVLDRIDKVLTWFEDWMLYLLVMVGLISLFIGVILRYVFNYTLAWSEELVRDVIIYTTFLGLAPAIKNGSMITIDALVQVVPRLRTPLSYVSHISVLVFSVMIFFLGWDMAALQARTFQKTIILEIPLVFIYCILPVMGVFMFIRTIQVMWKDYQALKSKKQAA